MTQSRPPIPRGIALILAIFALCDRNTSMIFRGIAGAVKSLESSATHADTSAADRASKPGTKLEDVELLHRQAPVLISSKCISCYYFTLDSWFSVSH